MRVLPTHKVAIPTHNNNEGTAMKALEEVKLVEVTLVLAVNSSYNALCGMDYIVVHDEAQLLGWSERDLEVKSKEEGQ